MCNGKCEKRGGEGARQQVEDCNILQIHYKKLGYFQWLKLSKKVLKTVETNIFNGWNDCKEPLLKTMLRTFFYGLYNH